MNNQKQMWNYASDSHNDGQNIPNIYLSEEFTNIFL